MSLTINGINTIQELAGQGQSLWLDNLLRDMICSGELARLRDAGITGITSNPTIFERAISGSTAYDEALARLIKVHRPPDQMLWDLMIDDIQAAADIFRPVYDATGGRTGLSRLRLGRPLPTIPSGLSLWRRISTSAATDPT